jgi:hypothetical protein
MICWMFVGVLFLAAAAPVAAQIRSETHEKYAASLWKFLHPTTGPKYVRWTVASRDLGLTAGPPSGPGAKTYLNPLAAAGDKLPHGSVVVTEHLAPGGDKPTAITIRYRFQPGYDSASDDWYWANYLPDGQIVRTMADKAPYDKRGFATYLQDGRLWILRLGSETLAEYLTSGELAKRVTRPGAGPGGLTVMSGDNETIDAYLTAKPGFETRLADGRLWVFSASSKELAEFEQHGELAKHVIRPGAGPAGITIKAPEAETIDAYLTAKPGFVTRLVDGRLWVFRSGGGELAEFDQQGELAKHVTHPGVGPGGVTVKAPDADTVAAYLAAADGFETKVQEGRIWVFRPGSSELAEFEKSGDLAKHITRPGAGPQGMTVKAADAETLDAYLRSAVGGPTSDG